MRDNGGGMRRRWLRGGVGGVGSSECVWVVWQTMYLFEGL
jgi:hypothetical protein